MGDVLLQLRLGVATAVATWVECIFLISDFALDDCDGVTCVSCQPQIGQASQESAVTIYRNIQLHHQ